MLSATSITADASSRPLLGSQATESRSLIMTNLSFTPNLLRYVESHKARVEGATVGQVLQKYFLSNPRVRGYVLDDQGALRKHIVIFVNQEPIHDRTALSDRVRDNDDIFVVQALSGG